MRTLFAVLALSSIATVTCDECWWSGCQPYTWAERGCYPSETWEQRRSEPCGGGDKYYCCRRTSNPGLSTSSTPSQPHEPENPGGHQSGDCFVTKDEFVKAVTSNGFRTPTDQQYQSMCNQARSAGGITSKQELAMFLAQILHESGGLVYKKEIACEQTGCPGVYDSSVGVPGKNYYGRGYMQLTHSYNYKAASLDLYNDLRLINNPDLVSDDENVAWATTFWYWKTRVRTAPNVDRFWFGATTKAINGALECNGANLDKAKKRFEFYKKTLTAFNLHVQPIENGCYN